MSTHIIQMTQAPAKETGHSIKSRFDAANTGSEEKRWLQRELDGVNEAKAYSRPPKLLDNVGGEGDIYGGMGENDSLGG